MTQATFYFAPELPRRRAIHLTLLTCTAGLAIGSEIAQALLPNGREFDPLDIAANVVGSTLALLLCSWYHKRMLERRRRNKHYDIVPGEALEDGEEDGERDVELGDVGREGAEEREEGGTVAVGGETGPGQADAGTTAASKATNVTEELDNWDENEADWDDGDDVAATTDTKAQETNGGAVDPVPKRRMD